ncbi:MAG: c-type cytochrome [Gallionella sp.]
MLKIYATIFRFCVIAIPIFITQTVFASDAENGRGVYVARCAICHGEAGVNIMQEAPNFTRYEGLMKSDALLLESLSNGKNAMPAYYGILSDQEMMDVIAFLRTLN